MSCRRVASKSLHYLRIGLTSIALFQFSLGASLAGAAPQPDHHDHDNRTPIKHVIVIIGENRSFDHVFATYEPKDGRNSLEPAFGRDRQRRRHSRAQFSQGGADAPPRTRRPTHSC